MMIAKVQNMILGGEAVSGNLNTHPQTAAANANDQALLDAQAEYEAISNE